jgi:Family of unknown function (DUF5675)
MNKVIVFKLVRDTYRGLTTLGTITCPDGTVLQTLEDCVRGWGIKDKGNTAIPVTTGEARYRLKVTPSQRFGKPMVIVFNQNDLTIKSNGIGFAGIRMHGGNTDKDVQGCIAIGSSRVNQTYIKNSAYEIVQAQVEKALKDGDIPVLEITNLGQLE